MILKQLDLNGFKSFVDSTRMDFTNGFTAVVGPNGCGKSNLSDAIRWVIGEQSAKMLRGSKITDLIFNGSSDRKPVNRAEISLTLGDVPPGLKIANVPNISSEIKITRCCHRSGESEFLINQIPCRLKDISDLLLDVGVSPKVLTVIEQGHIQDIVTSKPEERRIWIEEAAGILKFKTRRNEALRKLQASGQNLDRISDIVQELERQSASLKRQSAKAERYKELHVQIKEISLNLSSKKIRRFQKELGEITISLNEFNDQKTQWSAKSSTIENNIVEKKTQLDALFSSQNEKRESLHNLSNSIKQKEHDIELTSSHLKQANKDIEAAVLETERLRQDITNTEGELESNRSSLGTVSDEINEVESVLATKTDELDHLKASLEEQERNVNNSEGQILEAVQVSSRVKSELSALQARNQYLDASHEKLCLEKDGITTQLETSMTALSDAEIMVNDEKRSFETLQSQQDQVAREINTARDENQSGETNLQALKESWLKQSSTLNSIKDLRKKFEGFGEGVKSLMGDNEAVSGLCTALADVLKAPVEYEKAIESVLGERLQSLIVETHASSIAAINYLNQNKSGRGSFIPLQAKKNQRAPLYLNGNPKIIGKAAGLVSVSEEYHSILDRILGDTVITEDLETALSLHESDDFRGTIVTLNGEVIDEQGLVTGGIDNASGLLAQNRRIDDLENEVDNLHQKLEVAESDCQKAKDNLTFLEARQSEIQSAVHESEIRLNNSEKDLERLKSETARMKERQETVNRQVIDESNEQSNLAEQKISLEKELSDAEAKQSQAEQELASQREAMTGQRLKIDQALEALNVEKVLTASLKGKRENILSNIQRLNQQLENLRRSIIEREAGRQASIDKISKCEQTIKTLENEILGIAGEEDLLKEELVKVEESLNETELSLEQMEKESKDLYRQVQEITEQMSRSELRQSELKINVAHIEERAFEDYNVTTEEILSSYTGDVNEEKSGKDLATLKEKISRLGEVNLAALSEYKVVSKRYEFLARQQDDLAASVTALHETIEKINATTHKLFMDTFDQVNEQFKLLFGRLFGGGRAEMILCDPSNPLESGVDITASPLGKKMLHLSLLSGGEKTMTAIAMIFAILKVRPSPFCLLDEVDAPLDEANVLRLQEILKEMSDKTQFIMITHNQKTMSFANTLYGVTMEERGVSKIVSVNLNQSETSPRAA